MRRNFAIAISLANLCFIAAWRWLLVPSYSFYYYHYREPPPPMIYLALVLDVLLLAGVFLLVGSLVRRSNNERIKKFARVAFVLTLSVPLFGLFSQLDNHAIRRWLLSLLGDPEKAQRVLSTVPLTITLFLILICLWKINKAFRFAVALVLILTPFVVVTFLQAGFLARKYGALAPEQFAPRLAAEQISKRPRVVWFVFDEMEFRTVFSERPRDLELKELDRLRSESLFASNVFPPAQETFLSMPALITGKLVSNARRVSPSELMVNFGDDNKEVPWSDQPNVFSRARELGFNTALIGWYHPYCRILSTSLTRCTWTGQLPPSRLREASNSPQGLPHNMYSFFSVVIRSVPLVTLILQNNRNIPALARKKQVSDFDLISRQANELVTDPDIGLALIHWPIPHPPNVYNRFENRISADPGRSYLDNLALADKTIGQIRSSMEAKGLWKDTVVLITSDHWWRTSYWKDQSEWTIEDQATSKTEPDRRIPFILKMTDDVNLVEYDKPFNTVITQDLLLAILRGEVVDTKAVVAWLDQHRSTGRSPYDERTHRDDF